MEAVKFEQSIGEPDSQSKNYNAKSYFDVAKQDPSQRVKPFERFYLVCSNSLAITELS